MVEEKVWSLLSLAEELPDGQTLTTTHELYSDYGNLDSSAEWWLWEEAQHVCAKAERGGS